MYTVLFLLLGAVTHVTGFCSRPYDFLYWQPQTIIQRSIDADIIIYAEVVDSPCHKPEPLTTTPPPTTSPLLYRLNISQNGNATNERRVYTEELMPQPIPTTAPTTEAMNKTSILIPSHNCSAHPYNVSLKIHCVIKGGALPQFIDVSGIGLGKDMCVSDEWNETVHEYHAYHGQNYTFFLKREHNFNPQQNSFSLHPVNVQPAMVEVIDAETELKPIFKVAGRHAHVAMGVWANKTDPICKAYSGATGLTALTATLATVMSLVAMVTSF